MHLVLEKEDSWESARFAGTEGGSPEAGTASANGIDVFLLGYPYSTRTSGWRDAGGILEDYMDGRGVDTADLEGSFVFAVLDRPARRCLVVTDPYKIYTLFYCGRDGGDGLVISDRASTAAALAGRTAPDCAGILQLADFGFLLGERTVIEGVRSFEAATVSEFGPGLERSVSTYWEMKGGAPGKVSIDDVAAAFEEHVEQGLALGGRISMPLTAGLDSRAVLSSCIRETGRLHCYTHGDAGSEDVRISRRIAGRFGISHDHYPISGDTILRIPEIASSMADRCNGQLNTVMSAHFLPSYERESGRGDIFFSGIGGELMRSYYIPSPVLLKADTDTYARALRGRIAIRSDNGVFSGDLGREAESILDEEVSAELARMRTGEIQLLSERFYLADRVGNFMSQSMRLVGSYFRIFNPYLRRGMLELVSSLPGERKRGIEVQRRIIMRNEPRLAGILMDRARMIGGGPVLAARHCAGRTAFLLKLFANRLSGREIFGFGFTDYDSWIARNHGEFIRKTLDPARMIAGDLIDPDRLRAVTDRFLEGGSGLCHFVTALASTELFLGEVLRKAEDLRAGKGVR